jgi:hypothetical protein
MKRSSAVIEAAASQEAQALEGSQKDRVAKVIALHKDILGSLEDPDGTVRKAWAAFDKGDTGRAQRLMGLLVVNPNCDCPDLEIVLGYWEALECRVGDVMARLRRIAEWEGYEHRDLAGFLIAWSHLQIADLEAARRELEAFQAKFPDSQFREVSEKLLERIRPVARRGK